MSAIAIVSACGGSDDTKNTTTPTLGVSYAPATVSLAQGSSSTLEIGLSREALDGVNVTLTASGAPSGVTATFDPASTTGVLATLTLAAGLDATTGASTLTVTATADSGETASTTVAVTVGAPTPMTLTGTFANGAAIGYTDAIVRVFGSGATTPVEVGTNDDGSFTVTGIVPPYDIVATGPGGTDVFVGFTTATPYIGVLVENGFIETPQATVTGSITKISPGAKTLIDIYTPTGGGAPSTNAGDTNYTTTVAGPLAGTRISAEIRALQIEPGASGPTAYLGYFETATSLSTTGSNTIDVVPTGPIAARNFTLNMNVPAGFAIEQTLGFWLASNTATPELVSDSSGNTAPTFFLPSDERIPVAFTIGSTNSTTGASSALIRLVDPSAASLTADIPAGLANVQPADGATGVTDTASLSVDPAEGSTYVFTVTNASVSTDAFKVVTAAPTMSIARLRQLGVHLQAGATYQVRAIGIFGGTGDPLGRDRMSVLGLAKTDNSGYRVSPQASFTTAP